ncbi:homeodomain-like protein [Artemisia annua]|uniref:Homeodomain-like protein n=1 Tax=Artemisia annua TaxID=35608 RepID=A0A2U1MVQ1_ARTAN|nr:homeodomain-like protein [Artemisia annua]
MANPSGSGLSNNDVEHVSQVVDTPGVSTDWTLDEQAILEDGLNQYASESNIIRYAKIAVQLQTKTVRDVALRCRWMVKRDISKRRKEEFLLTRKNKDRKEKMIEHLASTSLANQTGPSYFHGVVANGNTNAIQHSVLVSPVGQLLKESAQALDRVSANLETQTHQVHENISLLCQVRKNIIDILLNLSDTTEKLKQMPPLPVKLNEDLLNSLIPRLQQMQ